MIWLLAQTQAVSGATAPWWVGALLSVLGLLVTALICLLGWLHLRITSISSKAEGDVGELCQKIEALTVTMNAEIRATDAQMQGRVAALRDHVDETYAPRKEVEAHLVSIQRLVEQGFQNVCTRMEDFRTTTDSLIRRTIQRGDKD